MNKKQPSGETTEQTPAPTIEELQAELERINQDARLVAACAFGFPSTSKREKAKRIAQKRGWTP